MAMIIGVLWKGYFLLQYLFNCDMLCDIDLINIIFKLYV